MNTGSISSHRTRINTAFAMAMWPRVPVFFRVGWVKLCNFAMQMRNFMFSTTWGACTLAPTRATHGCTGIFNLGPALWRATKVWRPTRSTCEMARPWTPKISKVRRVVKLRYKSRFACFEERTILNYAVRSARRAHACTLDAWAIRRADRFEWGISGHGSRCGGITSGRDNTRVSRFTILRAWRLWRWCIAIRGNERRQSVTAFRRDWKCGQRQQASSTT